MEYEYNPGVWGPLWIWVFGFFLFMAGLVLTVWFVQMARHADADDTSPRVIPRDAPQDAPPKGPA